MMQQSFNGGECSIQSSSGVAQKESRVTSATTVINGAEDLERLTRVLRHELEKNGNICVGYMGLPVHSTYLLQHATHTENPQSQPLSRRLSSEEKAEEEKKFDKMVAKGVEEAEQEAQRRPSLRRFSHSDNHLTEKFEQAKVTFAPNPSKPFQRRGSQPNISINAWMKLRTKSPKPAQASIVEANQRTFQLTESQIKQREKQISIGKSTIEYERFRSLSATDDVETRPRTPDPKAQCSKRSFDGMLKKWRRELHDFDPEVKPYLQKPVPVKGLVAAAPSDGVAIPTSTTEEKTRSVEVDSEEQSAPSITVCSA